MVFHGVCFTQCFVSVVIAREIDAVTVIDRIIDDDTFNTTTMGIVRLADVDTPENGESGYEVARASMITKI